MLSLNPWDILWTIVNLLVLYAIFRKFLFQPVMNIIHEREDMINKQFEDAQKQQDDAAQMKSEYENQLKGAREKRQIRSFSMRRRVHRKNITIKWKQPEPKQIICLRKQRVILQMSRKRQQEMLRQRSQSLLCWLLRRL